MKGSRRVFASVASDRASRRVSAPRPWRVLALAVSVLVCGVAAMPAAAATARSSAAATVTLLFEHQWIGPQENLVKEVIRRYQTLPPHILLKETAGARST